jgi:hypothetical protein
MTPRTNDIPTKDEMIDVVQLFRAESATPQLRLVISRAKIGPANGIFIKPVSEPAAPAYASVLSSVDFDGIVDFDSREVCNL